MLLHADRVSSGRMDFILRYFRRLFITVVSYSRARQRSVKEKRGVQAFLLQSEEKRYPANKPEIYLSPANMRG